MKSHARALALWWTYLHAFSLAWDALSIADVGGFLAGLRTGDGPQVPSIEPRESRFAESTISTRLRAVTSCYRFHEMNGVSLGGDLVRVVHGGRAACKPMLEHVARKKGRQRAVIRVRAARTAPPVLTPGQIDAICDACASPTGPGQSDGRVRDRFLWSLLAETGLRLGEALGLQHRDWHTGRGDTRSSRWCPVITRTGSGSREAATGGCSSPMSWTGSTGSTCGSCAAPARTSRCPTWTRRMSSSTWRAAPGSRHGGRRASMTW